MRTDEDLKFTLNNRVHNWQCKKLRTVEDLSDVIPHLFKEKFVVEIEGHPYDVSFGYNEEENYVGFGWSSAPSPHLVSSEFIDKVFRKGKWFVVEE
jgi:hypothetical protein